MQTNDTENSSLQKLDRKLDSLNDKINELDKRVGTIAVDVNWLKWIFGVYSIILTVLLGVLINLAYRLAGV